jgi:hypothetical protein
MVHADFIERDHDLDYFACFSNTQLTKYKKWEIKAPKQTFKIWFTDMNGVSIIVKTKAEEEVERRREEMLKQYEDRMTGSRLNTQTDDNDVRYSREDGQTTGLPGTPGEGGESTDIAYISAFVLELMLIY